jgi:hypothetical protein
VDAEAVSVAGVMCSLGRNELRMFQESQPCFLEVSDLDAFALVEFCLVCPNGLAFLRPASLSIEVFAERAPRVGKGDVPDFE